MSFSFFLWPDVGWLNSREAGEFSSGTSGGADKEEVATLEEGDAAVEAEGDEGVVVVAVAGVGSEAALGAVAESRDPLSSFFFLVLAAGAFFQTR